MATIREKAKKFHKFVRGLKPKHGQALLEPNAPLLDRFVFYLLLYSNSVASARKALKALTDDKTFASWSEVRVATAREIADILHEHKIRPADFLAKCLKDLLQRIFEEVDDTSFEPLIAELAEAENAKARKAIGDNAKKWIGELPGIPPWGATYLLTGLSVDPQLPWDPHTETVLDGQNVFPAKSTLAQKKRVAKALLDGLDDLEPLDVHHLLVEHAKRDTKRK